MSVPIKRGIHFHSGLPPHGRTDHANAKVRLAHGGREGAVRRNACRAPPLTVPFTYTLECAVAASCAHINLTLMPSASVTGQYAQCNMCPA